MAELAVLFNDTRPESPDRPRRAPGLLIARRVCRVVVLTATATIVFAAWLRFVAQGDSPAMALGAVLWLFFVGGEIAEINPFANRAVATEDGIELHLQGRGSRFVSWAQVNDVAIWGQGDKCRAMVLEEPDLWAWTVPCSMSSSPNNPDLVTLVSLFNSARSAAPADAWSVTRPVGSADGGRVRVVGQGDLLSALWVSVAGPLLPVYLAAYTVGHLVGAWAATAAGLGVVAVVAAVIALVRRDRSLEATSYGVTFFSKARRRSLPWSEITAIDVSENDEWAGKSPASPLVISLKDGTKVGAPWMVALLPPQFLDTMVQRLLTARPPQSNL